MQGSVSQQQIYREAELGQSKKQERAYFLNFFKSENMFKLLI